MKRLIALFITVGLLTLLIARVDVEVLRTYFARTRPGWFAAALFLFVPQILTIAWRWKRLVSVFTPLPLTESIRLIFASQAMNLVLPSKMGDLTKGYFLSRGGALDLKRAMNVVVFEKLLDVAMLAAFMLAGVALIFAGEEPTSLQLSAAWVAGGVGIFALAAVSALYFIPVVYLPGFARVLEWLERKPSLKKVHSLVSSSHEVITLLQGKGARRSEIVALSALIWIWHLVQIYCFFRAVGVSPALGSFFAMVPLAIFIGLLPLTIAGFGTRDAALVALFPAFPSAAMLAVAFYINLRYLLPAAVGIPLLSRYTITRMKT